VPVLHTYRKKEGHYILAGVNGRIVTYRLSQDGVKLLADNGINDSDKFSWQILLELIRQGEAYTSAPGADDEDLSGWTQLGLFNIQDNEPAAADPVPLCACGSMDGLHIVEQIETKTAILLCDTCRRKRRDEIDASVPVYLITTSAALEHLLERSGLKPDQTVIAYGELLNLSHAAIWNGKAASKKKMVQAGLFSEAEVQQQSLL